MAKQMAYTSVFGVDFPDSYWKFDTLILNVGPKQGVFTFYGYANVAAREALREPVGTQSYEVTGDIYDALFSATIQDQEGYNPIKSAYEYASSDSFFQNAQNV